MLELILVAVLVLIDQLTKQLAKKYLEGRAGLAIIKGVLELYYLPGGNTGAAWGLFSGYQFMLVAVSVIVVLGIGFILLRIPCEKKYSMLRVLLVFILAGGIGNMIDRIALRSVRDFIYISIINFPVFNVADMYVSCSVVLLMILFIFVFNDDDIRTLEGHIYGRFKRKDRNPEGCMVSDDKADR